MKAKISERQQNILDFIKSELKSKGYPPSIREICDAVGLNSSSTVHGHLERLEKKGYIKRDKTKPRTIEILDENFQLNSNSSSVEITNSEVINVPIVGQVAAGIPITAEENIEDLFPVPLSYFKSNQELFMLRVKGDSMINVGINEDDLLLMEKSTIASNGEIVVAMVNDGYEPEATVKRIYYRDNHVILQPENDYYEPIISHDVSVLGKVIGLFRVF